MNKMIAIVAGLALSGAASAADLDVLGAADYEGLSDQEMTLVQGEAVWTTGNASSTAFTFISGDNVGGYATSDTLTGSVLFGVVRFSTTSVSSGGCVNCP